MNCSLGCGISHLFCKGMVVHLCHWYWAVCDTVICCVNVMIMCISLCIWYLNMQLFVGIFTCGLLFVVLLCVAQQFTRFLASVVNHFLVSCIENAEIVALLWPIMVLTCGWQLVSVPIPAALARTYFPTQLILPLLLLHNFYFLALMEVDPRRLLWHKKNCCADCHVHACIILIKYLYSYMWYVASLLPLTLVNFS